MTDQNLMPTDAAQFAVRPASSQTLDLKKSMKTVHDESERLGNLEAKVDAISAMLQQLVEK